MAEQTEHRRAQVTPPPLPGLNVSATLAIGMTVIAAFHPGHEVSIPITPAILQAVT